MASRAEAPKRVGSASGHGTGIAPLASVPRQIRSEALRQTVDVFESRLLAGTEGRARRPRRPQLPSLLLTRETATMRAIRGVALREDIPLDVCENADDALQVLAVKPYQALLVDFDMPGNIHVLNSLRERADKPVTVAMVASGTLLGTAFDVGAILAIHKPVVAESVRLGLKAAYSVAARQGRKSRRRPARVPCRLGLPGSRLMPGSIVNVGEGGACVATDRCMPPGTFLTLRFSLPGTEPILDIGAVAVWNDGERRTGLRFQRLHYRHAGRIRNFVQSAQPTTRLSAR